MHWVARADGKSELFTLTVTGGTPTLRRGFNFWHGVCIAGVGTVIGSVLGILPVLALALGSPASNPSPFVAPVLPLAVAPVLPLAVAAVGIPLLIGLGSALFTIGTTPKRPANH